MPPTRSRPTKIAQKSTPQENRPHQIQPSSSSESETNTTKGTSTTRKQSVRCTQCDNLLSQAADLHRHWLRYHATDAQKEPYWNYCEYRYINGCTHRDLQKSNLVSHHRIHSGEKPFSCPRCQRPFADRSACKRHCRAEVCRGFVGPGFMGSPLPLQSRRLTRKAKAATAKTPVGVSSRQLRSASDTTFVATSTPEAPPLIIPHSAAAASYLPDDLSMPESRYNSGIEGFDHVVPTMARWSEPTYAFASPASPRHYPQVIFQYSTASAHRHPQSTSYYSAHSALTSPLSWNSASAATTPSTWIPSGHVTPPTLRPQGRYDPVRDIYLDITGDERSADGLETS